MVRWCVINRFSVSRRLMTRGLRSVKIFDLFIFIFTVLMCIV